MFYYKYKILDEIKRITTFVLSFFDLAYILYLIEIIKPIKARFKNRNFKNVSFYEDRVSVYVYVYVYTLNAMYNLLFNVIKK